MAKRPDDGNEKKREKKKNLPLFRGGGNDDHLDRLTFVEDKNIRIFDECTSDGDALFLPTG